MIDKDTIKKHTDILYSEYKSKIRKGVHLTEGSKQKIKTRLSVYSLEELLRAIDNFSKSKWWMQNNSGQGMQWFFNSDDRIERFLGIEPDKKTRTITLENVDEITNGTSKT